MKVFILEGIYYNEARTEDSKSILGVFSTREKADKEKLRLEREHKEDINFGYIEYDIQSYDVH